MDADAQERFEKVELRLSEHDEKIIAHDSRLTAIANLLRTGIRMLVDLETSMRALTDSEARLYGTMQELADAHQRLAEAQKRTEESLRRFLDRSGDGHAA